MSAPHEPAEDPPPPAGVRDPQIGRDARAEPGTDGAEASSSPVAEPGVGRQLLEPLLVLLAGASLLWVVLFSGGDPFSAPGPLAAAIGQALLAVVIVVDNRQRRQRARAAAERAGGGLGLRARGGASCPLCKVALGTERVSRCAGCGTEAHVACTLEMGGCSTLGCPTRHAPRRRA